MIDPASAPATTPPSFDGPWAPADDRLDRLVRYPLPGGTGPEDVVVDPDGRPISGADDGRIWRWPAPLPGGSSAAPPRPELLADTGGRPLGLELDPRDGSLVVCDAHRGLLRVTPDGAVAELTGTAAGTPIRFCNNAAVAADGVVYFTDSSNRYPVEQWRLEVLEHRPNGRLLRYDPATGATDTVATGLYFPNGVALTPDGSALMLVETTMHRLSRVTLDGRVEVVADLPAYPDNMAPVGDGTYWIALASPRLAALERLLPHPRVRRVVGSVPAAFQPRPKRYGLVARVDGAGRVLRTLHGPGGGYAMVTGVRQHADTLWLGSLTESAIARVDLA